MNDIRLLDKIQKNLYRKEYNKEFAVGISEHIGGAPIMDLMLLCEDGQEHFLKKVVLHEPKNQRVNDERYISENGVRSINGFMFKKDFEDQGFEKPERLILKNSEESLDVDRTIVEKVKESIKDNFILVKEFTLTDKNGDDYQAIYKRNNDPTINFPAIVDEINVYKDGEKVAYLMAKYYSDESVKKAKEMGEKVDSDVIDRFLNKATIDYIRVEDGCKSKENYQGRGLATLMYLNMAQLCNENGMSFRSSTIRSDDAKNVWKGMRSLVGNKYVKKDALKNGYGKDEEIYYLTPPQNQSFHDYKDTKEYFKNLKSIQKRKPTF